ncbi:rhomboid family intramembrane serine protease [Streptomyces benahoarensis]|uniref:Rhomboid family intramembrane serine protease n=1 Tax=Streptomyces benahoarensis TaxID=2595054 RepID=A0A553ZN76_9ACTN|nr:rhomboid family intramembrane serine protease [Streptomyces benahoarensis]TSB25555.1 rhomboid family intramembrane serine protease [Streptomyces benahoarensis]TSB42873.1 rhomboid family intramembrane serine protease [Streptomyces benahoarensis]
MDQVPGTPQEPQGADGASGLPGCYRHPDRPTGVTCTRCERPICPECMVSASVGFQCPECVRAGSGTGHSAHATTPRTLAGGSIAADPKLITKILLGLNVAVFIAVYASSGLIGRLDMIGLAFDPQHYQLVGVAEGQWYRLFTAVFLHQEIPHIAFNMLSLWWLGPPLEAALGRLRYTVLYLLAGLGGSALSYLLAAQNQPSLGASGAIFGLLGATAVLLRRLNYDMKPVLILLGLNLVFTFLWPNIAWQAHVGGLVIGAAVAYGMVHAPRERRTLVHTLTCVAALLMIVGVVWVRTLQLTG